MIWPRIRCEPRWTFRDPSARHSQAVQSGTKRYYAVRSGTGGAKFPPKTGCERFRRPPLSPARQHAELVGPVFPARPKKGGQRRTRRAIAGKGGRFAGSLTTFGPFSQRSSAFCPMGRTRESSAPRKKARKGEFAEKRRSKAVPLQPKVAFWNAFGSVPSVPVLRHSNIKQSVVPKLPRLGNFHPLGPGTAALHSMWIPNPTSAFFALSIFMRSFLSRGVGQRVSNTRKGVKDFTTRWGLPGSPGDLPLRINGRDLQPARQCRDSNCAAAVQSVPRPGRTED